MALPSPNVRSRQGREIPAFPFAMHLEILISFGRRLLYNAGERFQAIQGH
jgi:hypothetical protein